MEQDIADDPDLSKRKSAVLFIYFQKDASQGIKLPKWCHKSKGGLKETLLDKHEKISEVIKDVFIKENMNTLNFSHAFGEDSCLIELKWSGTWKICWMK